MYREKLTRKLIAAHLFSFITLSSKNVNGVQRWAWALSPMGDNMQRSMMDESEDVFKFSSRDTAMNFALGWITRNRPDLEKAAVAEAKQGIAYRANQLSL